MIRFGNQPPTTTSVGENTCFLPMRQQPVSVAEQKENDICLDDVIAQLKTATPGLAESLKETARELSFLATTGNGDVTVTSLRLAIGLTQKEFAAAVNWQQPNVSAMEAGQRSNPNRETMRLMCRVLECDMTTLDRAIENSKTMLEKQISKQEKDLAEAHLKTNKMVA